MFGEDFQDGDVVGKREMVAKEGFVGTGPPPLFDAQKSGFFFFRRFWS